MLPAVCLQQDSSLQKICPECYCFCQNGEFLAFERQPQPTHINSFIEVQQESGERVSKN